MAPTDGRVTQVVQSREGRARCPQRAVESGHSGLLNPKGCQRVAGGRSAAKTSGKNAKSLRIPEGCHTRPPHHSPARANPGRPEARAGLARPPGCGSSLVADPEVSAALRPPATVWQPSGLRLASQNCPNSRALSGQGCLVESVFPPAGRDWRVAAPLARRPATGFSRPRIEA